MILPFFLIVTLHLYHVLITLSSPIKNPYKSTTYKGHIFWYFCESANHSFKTGVDILAGKGFVGSKNGNIGNKTKK